MNQLDRLRQLLQAATPGPWSFRATEHSGGIRFVVSDTAPRNQDGTEFVTADCSHGYNGKLIASAVNALPALLRVAEAAKEASRLLDEWELIRHHSYAHEALRDSLAALDKAGET